MINRKIIEIQGNLYQIVRKFPEKSINLEVENGVSILKQYYYCDTIFKAKGYLWLCNKIIDINYEEL